MSASAIDRIHSTRVIDAEGMVKISRTDYGVLYAAAVRGGGGTVTEEPSDLPHVDGLGIAELGIFPLPADTGAHSEFRVWLNNGQRLSFAVPATRRLYWFTKMVLAFFQGDLRAVE